MSEATDFFSALLDSLGADLRAGTELRAVEGVEAGPGGGEQPERGWRLALDVDAASVSVYAMVDPPRDFLSRSRDFFFLYDARDADSPAVEARAAALCRALAASDPGDAPAGVRAGPTPQRVPMRRTRQRRDVQRADIEGRLAEIARRRGDGPELLCTRPWTTMEVSDPSGVVYQCCSDWTHGDRGNVNRASLLDVWNGPAYQAARRMMAGDVDALCRGVCPRRYDRAHAEPRFTVRGGTTRFVENQLLLAEDIALRRPVTRGRPLDLTLCPSSYCNYDCVMCTHGRSPRRDMRGDIWEQVQELLPTLSLLNLLGGEPFADPQCVDFLRGFNRSLYPDARIAVTTNGSLLTERLLARLERCAFSSITISLNAGTPEVYDAVQRGIAWAEVLRNLDAILAYRARQAERFAITLSFVVMGVNAHTLLPFAELAHRLGVGMRLLPLGVERVPELDYYADPDEVTRVLGHLGELEAWARRVEPTWVPEIEAVCASIQSVHAGRVRREEALRGHA